MRLSLHSVHIFLIINYNTTIKKRKIIFLAILRVSYKSSLSIEKKSSSCYIENKR